jgi:hypothetical protein
MHYSRQGTLRRRGKSRVEETYSERIRVLGHHGEGSFLTKHHWDMSRV